MQSRLTSYIRFLSATASLCRGETAKDSGWQMEEVALTARQWQWQEHASCCRARLAPCDGLSP